MPYYCAIRLNKPTNYFWESFHYHFFLLKKIQSGVESITAVKLLLKEGHISQNCVLMVAEMYLQKGTQFNCGEYIGKNEDDILDKGIMLFMITSLKSTETLAIKACPKVTVNCEWLSQEILECIF